MQFTIKEESVAECHTHGFSENRNLAYAEFMGFIHCMESRGNKYFNVGYVDDEDIAKKWLAGEAVEVHTNY